MTYGVLPSRQANGPQLRICKVSAYDDFRDRVELDPGDIETVWSSPPCIRGRTLPIVNLVDPEDGTGVVFHKPYDGSVDTMARVGERPRDLRLIGALVAGAVAGGLAVVALRGRR